MEMRMIMKNLDKKCYGKFRKTKAYGLVGCLAFSGFLLVSGVGGEDAHAAVVNGGSDIVATDVHSKEASGVAMTYTTFDSNGSKQVASGSGVFVAPNVMVTVAHNYLDKNKETGTSFVRGGNSATSYVVMNSESAKYGNNTSSGYDDIIPKGNIHYYNDKEFVTSYSGDLAAVVTEKPVEAMTNGEDHARDLGTARQGDKITFMGYPNDFSSKRLSEESKSKLVNGKMYKVSGTLSSLDTITGSGTYNTSALGGFSGGPIFNERGEVVGIHQHGTNTDAGDDSSQHGGGLFFTDKHRAWINKMIEEHAIKGWFVNGNDKYYYDDNHKAVVNTERTIDGAKYRFDANGRGTLLSGVEKGSVVTNYYIENTTTKLADSVSQSDLDVGTKYQTRPVTPIPKIETEDLEDRTITRTTKYELVKTPDNASGDIIKGETVVNYYYRPVTTENVVMKEFKDIVTYHSETRYDVQHVFDVELEKDVTGFDNNSIFLHQKYGTKTEIARSIYDAALGFGEKKGVYPPLSKIREAEDNFAKMLGYESREDYLKHNKNAIFDLTERPLFQYDHTYSTIQSDLTTGYTQLSGDVADFRTRGTFGDLDVFEKADTNVLNTYESRLPDGAELELTKITYNIDGGEEKLLPTTGFPFSRENGTMQKGKTTHYTYHYKLKKREEVTNTENLTGSVVVKYVTTDGQEIKDAVTIQKNAPAGQRLTKSIISGTADLGSKTEVVDGTTKYDAGTVKEERIEKDGKTYVLTRVLPKDARFKNTDSVAGIVKEGLTTVVYEYKEVEKAPVTVHYYKDGTTEELAPSVDKGKSDIGSNYTTEPVVIQPKVTVQDLPEKVVTTTTRYELKEVPKDKDGLVPVGGKVVTYYYVEKVDVKEVLKQAPVTVHYYKDGTTEKLADSIEQGKKDIGSKYVTEAKVIEPKVTVEETPEKIITRTVRYELKEVPKDKDGVVPVGGKVVTYYYVEKVDVKEVLKQAPVTVHYYKDGTTEKLADSIEKGKQDIGSKYVTEAPRVIEEKLKDGSVRKWLLKAVPFNANGEVKVGGTTVIYYYMEFSIPKDAPVVELPEYNVPQEEPKVEVPKVQPKPLEIPKPTPVEVVKEEPKVIPVVRTVEPVVQQKVLPNTGSSTTNTAGLGFGVIAVGAVMVKQRRKLGKRQ